MSGGQEVGETMRAQNGEAILRAGIVHRLDRDTSGVLILAKDQPTYDALKAQFKDRHIKKTYRALVYGTMKERFGTIDRQIGRSASDPRKRSAEPGAKGTRRDALTHWELIANHDGYAELMLRPVTGRTHQLRVHLKAIGRPIIGDTLYATDKLALFPDHTDRLYLHAHTLTLTLDGDTHTFTAPLPEAFTQLM